MKKILIFFLFIILFLILKPFSDRAIAATCSLVTNPISYTIDPQSSTQPQVNFTITTDLGNGAYHVKVSDWPIGGGQRGGGGTSFQATNGTIQIDNVKPYGGTWKGATTYSVKIADTNNTVLCGGMQLQVHQSDIHQYCSIQMQQNTPGVNSYRISFSRPQSEDSNNPLLNGSSTNNLHRPVLKEIAESNNIGSEVRNIDLDCVTTQELGNFHSVGNLTEGHYYLQMRAGCSSLRLAGDEFPVACDTLFDINNSGGLQSGDTCDPTNDLCPLGTTCSPTEKICKIDLASPPDIDFTSPNNPYNTAPPPLPCDASDVVGGNCKSVATGLGISISTDVGKFITSLLGILLSISGGIAVLLIIIAGYRLMISQGNPEKIQPAREQLTAAIVGLLFIIFSLVIIQVIGYDILHIPGFGQ